MENAALLSGKADDRKMCIRDRYTDSADGEFSDGSEDAQMAGTTVIDTSQQLTGTHHAAITVKDYGEIDVELDADTAPITVTNFVKLVQDNFYDGLTFHRIIDGFMIQGGDPNGDGTGGAEAVSYTHLDVYKRQISLRLMYPKSLQHSCS